MLVQKISPNAEAGGILQQLSAANFVSQFSNIVGAVDSGNLSNARRAMADFLAATAYTAGTQIDALNQSNTFRTAFEALRNSIRVGDINNAQAALSRIRQAFLSPVNSIAGTDLRQIQTTPGSVAGTDLHQIQTTAGSIAGTDLRTIQTVAGSIAGTDFHTLKPVQTPTGGVAGTDLHQIQTAPGSVAGTDLHQIQTSRFHCWHRFSHYPDGCGIHRRHGFSYP
jgi:hypothetical protein